MSALALVGLQLALAASLTEAGAVALALEKSPVLRAVAQRAAEEAARGEVATVWENPQLRLQSLRSDRLLTPLVAGQPFGDHPFGNLSLGLRWMPPNPMVHAARRSAARRLVEAAEAEAAQARRRVVARVRSLFATVLSVEQQIALAQRALGLKVELAALAKARVEQRAASALDQSLAELDALEARAQAVELSRRRREAMAALAVELGLDEDAVLEVEGEPGPCSSASAPAAALAERAVEKDPELAKHRALLAALEAERDEVRLALIPWFDYLQLAYVLATDTRPAFGTLQTGFTFPLVNWGGARSALLSVQAQQEALGAERARLALEREVEATVADLAEHADLTARYRTVEPQLLEQSRAQLAQALAAGAFNLSQVALAQSRSLQAQRAGLKAELECRLLMIKLEQLVGSSPDARGP